jgi:choline dehydrogenase
LTNFVNAICIGALSTHVPKHFNRKDTHVYDYVVVGAGSAGCVVAARLSEDPSVSVALIEAGGEDTAPEIHIPTAFPTLFKTAWDCDFDSECEPGLGGRRVYLPRGRMLGGSSSMNAMVYIRGNANDYDDWASATRVGLRGRTSVLHPL